MYSHYARYMLLSPKDEDEANVLCKSLGCGTFKEIPKEYWEVPEEFEGSKKMVVNCSGIEGLDNLWQCAPQPNQKCSIPAFVICTGNTHKLTHILCLLKCCYTSVNCENASFEQITSACKSNGNNQMSVKGSCKLRKIVTGGIINQRRLLRMLGAIKCTVIKASVTQLRVANWNAQVKQWTNIQPHLFHTQPQINHFVVVFPDQNNFFIMPVMF